eukprot:7491192-Alexandrium_andersonii.AAC.1
MGWGFPQPKGVHGLQVLQSGLGGPQPEHRHGGGQALHGPQGGRAGGHGPVVQDLGQGGGRNIEGAGRG